MKPLGSKIYKNDLFAKASDLRPFLPAQCEVGAAGEAALLRAHSFYYVKPIYGTGGRGIYRLQRLPSGAYEAQYGRNKKLSFADPAALQRWFTLLKQSKGSPYLLQQGIALLHFQNRPFDSRYMVQVHPTRRTMDITGYAGRIAGRGLIVTNHCRGGRMYPLEALLRSHLPKPAALQAVLTRSSWVVQRAANFFQQHYPRVRELGFDIAWDQDYHPWILEVNTQPCFTPFGTLAQKTMIQRIQRYHAALYPTRKRILPSSPAKISMPPPPPMVEEPHERPSASPGPA